MYDMAQGHATQVQPQECVTGQSYVGHGTRSCHPSPAAGVRHWTIICKTWHKARSCHPKASRRSASHGQSYVGHGTRSCHPSPAAGVRHWTIICKTWYKVMPPKSSRRSASHGQSYVGHGTRSCHPKPAAGVRHIPDFSGSRESPFLVGGNIMVIKGGESFSIQFNCFIPDSTASYT